MNDIKIESADVIRYLADVFDEKCKELSIIKNKNDYVNGQLATMRNIAHTFSMLVDPKVWNAHNVINNFYRLQRKDKRFEKKYKKIWI